MTSMRRFSLSPSPHPLPVPSQRRWRRCRTGGQGRARQRGQASLVAEDALAWRPHPDSGPQGARDEFGDTAIVKIECGRRNDTHRAGRGAPGRESYRERDGRCRRIVCRWLVASCWHAWGSDRTAAMARDTPMSNHCHWIRLENFGGPGRQPRESQNPFSPF